MFLFTDFALSKNKRFSFKQGDCHFLVFSVSSVCILISTSNKYRSFSYLDICRYFGVVRTTPAVRLLGFLYPFNSYYYTNFFQISNVEDCLCFKVH